MHIRKNYFIFITALSISIFINAKEYDKFGILAGNLSNPSDIGYIVAILSRDNNNSTSISCGGGIITDQFIVSAASCFMNKNYEFYDNIKSIAISVGTIQNPNFIPFDIEQIYVPDSYNATTYRDNIAVLKLKAPLDLKKNKLKKLRIPAKSRGNFAGKNAVIAGYGWDEINVTVHRNSKIEVEGSTLGYLYTANTIVLSDIDCQSHHVHDIEDTILCAKLMKGHNERNYGTCKLDEGGPLVYKSKTLIGVLIKVTDACDETEDPAQYTRITTQLKFIENALQNKTDNMYFIIL